MIWVVLSPASDVTATVAVNVDMGVGQTDGFDGVIRAAERERIAKLDQRYVVQVTKITDITTREVGVARM